ncbi:hypothetical protein [uncultured Alistipes sp.]|jgi:hypothetical protein|uniref:hypothetical protein n=1 Tax=uncultured Alistipes sp. TaxID=538949 RepID=UPI0020660321|nr:hypothetical protein [uncultured Alistipes sp.]DAL54693.1 MAG TPA_asm: hypothetical protein [Caudoviricetes sp.]
MQDKMDKGLGWLEKLLNMEKTFGFFRIIRALLLMALTSIVLLFTFNPRYLFERMEALQTERHADAVTRRINADAEIRLILHRLLHTLDADRAWLIELHNGSKNLSSGLPFLYGDMRIEEVAEGIGNVDDEYTDFQLSKYPFVGKVFEDGYYWGAIDSVRTVDERMYFKFKSNDVNEIALLALYSGEKPLGALGVSFCGDKQMDSQRVGKIIRKCGVQIATLLSNTDRKNQ